MLVRDVMSDEVVKAGCDETVHDGIEKMLRNRVGSVIVTRKGDPMGIVTETDVLKHGYRSRGRFTETSLSKIMSSPLVNIQPEKSIREAAETMRAESVKKVAVMDHLDLMGIITLSDIVYSHSDILKEAHRLDTPDV